MALLTFPFPATNGQVYPVSPPAGTNIYTYSSTDQTWRLLGPASGAVPGVYGTPTAVPEITVDATGRITSVQNVSIQLGTTAQVGLVQLVDDTTSNDSTKALTAAMGYRLANEIGDTSLLNPFYPNLVTAVNALGAPSGVTAGTYGNSTNVGRFTVNAQGRITSATNVPLALATTISPGVIRVGANLAVTGTGVLSVPNASTTQRGAVQLVDNTATNDNTKALTASAGYDLQLQIDALEARNNLTFAGTISGATGLMLSVTAQGAALGFVVGAALPLPSLANNEYFVVVTVPGTFTPTGGAPQACNDGDWFVSDGSQWLYYNVGPTVAAATFIQLDDISGQFNNTRVSFVLRVSGTAYTPVSASAILLSVGGVIQIPGNSFTLSGSTVTFTEAPKTNTTFVGYAVSGLTGGGGGGGGGGTGTVTSVGTGTGLIGGPITTTGTISLRPATNSTLGGVIPDNTTITVSPTGVISASSAGVGTLQSVTNNGATTTNAINVGGLSSTGNMVFGDSSSDTISVPARFASSLIPNANEVYDLGSATNRWRDLYVSSNSIYMGTNQLTVSGGQLLINGTPVGGGGSVGTLQQVTDAGATTTRSIIVGGITATTNGGYFAGTALGNMQVVAEGVGGFGVKPSSAGLLSGRFEGNGDLNTLGNITVGAIASRGDNNGIQLINGSTSAVTINLNKTSGRATVNSLVAAGLTYPTADGTSGQVLTTNGAGILSWTTAGGGSVGTLQTVTNNGATTTNTIDVRGLTVTDNTSTQVASINSVGTGTFRGGVIAGNPLTGNGGLIVAGGLTVQDANSQRFSVNSITGAVNIGNSGDPASAASVNLYSPISASPTVSLTANTGRVTSRQLVVAGLTYPTTDGTSGQVLTTNGAGVLSWASGSGAVSTLQQVTTAGNTTTNTIRLFDSGTSSEAITLDPLNGQISVLPQAIGEPGFYISPTAVFFGNSSGDVRAGGTFPATLQFNGSLGTNIKTVSSTIPVQLWAGGLGGVATPQLSVTGTYTSISNILRLTDPTQTTTWGEIRAIDSSNLSFVVGPSNSTILLLNPTTTTITSNLQMAGYIQVNSPNGIRFYESSGVDYVGLRAPSSLGASYNLSLPPANGTADQVLATDGTGDLQWLTTAKIVAVPASSASGGAAGQIAFGGGFFYWFNSATNQWLRVAGNTF